LFTFIFNEIKAGFMETQFLADFEIIYLFLVSIDLLYFSDFISTQEYFVLVDYFLKLVGGYPSFLF